MGYFDKLKEIVLQATSTMSGWQWVLIALGGYKIWDYYQRYVRERHPLTLMQLTLSPCSRFQFLPTAESSRSLGCCQRFGCLGWDQRHSFVSIQSIR